MQKSECRTSNYLHPECKCGVQCHSVPFRKLACADLHSFVTRTARCWAFVIPQVFFQKSTNYKKLCLRSCRLFISQFYHVTTTHQHWPLSLYMTNPVQCAIVSLRFLILSSPVHSLCNYLHEEQSPVLPSNPAYFA